MTVPRAALALGFAWLLVAAAGSDAPASEEVGDRVEVTLKGGKRFVGILAHSDDNSVVVRIGDSPVSLARSMIADIEALPEPKPDPAPEAEGDETSGEEEVEGGQGEEGEEGAEGAPPAARRAGIPKPATVLLKDGTVMEVFVVSREGGRLWFLPAPVKEIPLEEVDEIFGDSGGLGGGARITGDALEDSMTLMREMDSGVESRVRLAQAGLQSLGEDAVPALVRGLDSRVANTRMFCLSALAGMKSASAMDALLKVLRVDLETMVRATAAELLIQYNQPVVRRALLETVWRDSEDQVKAAAMATLARTATVEEASALMDLMGMIPEDSAARPQLFNALRKATSQKFASLAELWLKWWDEGGREASNLAAHEALEARMRQEAEKAGFSFATPEPAAPSPSEPIPSPEEAPLETPPEEGSN